MHFHPWAEKGYPDWSSYLLSMTHLASTELVFLLILREWCGERFLYQMALLHCQNGGKEGERKAHVLC